MKAPLRRLPEVRQANKKRAALCYASRGLPVFPCHTLDAKGRCTCRRECKHPGKHPIEMPLCQHATAQRETVEMWWGEWPSANIATPVGNGRGIAVLDIDVPEGLESIKEMCEVHGAMPRPVCASRSPSEGLHYFYESLPVGGVWMPGLTALIEGPEWPHKGYYVLLPPSTTVGRYEWIAVK